MITRAVSLLCVALLVAQNPYTLAQNPQSAGGSSDQSQRTLTPAQLDSLVAPIALYPDPILSQTLVASTYPLEIVEAARWLSQNSKLTGKQLIDAAAKQPWDASVQALVVLPDVLKRLNQNIGWTSDLGNAFLAQQQDVMDAIQRLRQKASDAGALKSTSEQTVSTATDNNRTYIEIQPASTEVVYVPQYNPVAVWGPPPEYYPYPPIYYPPYGASAISFGVGMAVGAIWAGGGGWGGWGWGCGWGRNNVVINNNFVTRNNFNRVNVGNGNNWVHNPAHRAGVPYNNRNVANRYQGATGNLTSRPTVSQTQQRLNQTNPGQRGAASRQGPSNIGQSGAGQRPTQGSLGQRGAGGVPTHGSANRAGQGNLGQGGGDHIGNRNLGGAGSGGNGAFGGMNQGGNRARMDSNRGSASRSGGFSGGGGGFRGGGGGFRGGGGGRGGGGRRR